MSEINGLQNIVNSATLHGITEPPEPCEFPDRESYLSAYEQWWTDTHCWKASCTGQRSGA